MDTIKTIEQMLASLEGYRIEMNDYQPCDAEKAGRALLDEIKGQEPTCKQYLQVWVISNGKGAGQFSWEPQDESFWTRMQPAATIKESLTVHHPQPAQPKAEQEPVAFKCGDAIVHIRPPVYGNTHPQPKAS